MAFARAAGPLVDSVVRAAIPLAGVTLLGWPAASALFLYCADVLAALYAACVLACPRLFGFERAVGPGWWQRLWFGAELALTAAIPWAVVAVALSATMGMVVTLAGFDWHAALSQRGVWLGVLAQFAAAVRSLLRDYDAVLADPDADRRVRRRFGLAFLRWALVAAAGFVVLAWLPQRALVLVALCSAVQVLLELVPDPTLRALHAPDLAEPAAPPLGSREASRAPPLAQRHVSRAPRRRHRR